MLLAEQEQLAFEIGPDTPPERCAEIYGRWLAFRREVRRVDELMKGALIERDATFEIGATHYWIGDERKNRLRDADEGLRLLLEVIGPEAVARCIASDGLKCGQVRKELEAVGQPDLWLTIFDVEIKQDVKTGKAEKALLSVNESYMPQSRREQGNEEE